MYVTMFSISLLIKNIIIRIQYAFDSVQNTQNEVFWSVKNRKKTRFFTLWKTQGNKVFQSVKNTMKHDVSICQNILLCFKLLQMQGNAVFQSVKTIVTNTNTHTHTHTHTDTHIWIKVTRIEIVNTPWVILFKIYIF